MSGRSKAEKESTILRHAVAGNISGVLPLEELRDIPHQSFRVFSPLDFVGEGLYGSFSAFWRAQEDRIPEEVLEEIYEALGPSPFETVLSPDAIIRP